MVILARLHTKLHTGPGTKPQFVLRFLRVRLDPLPNLYHAPRVGCSTAKLCASDAMLFDRLLFNGEAYKTQPVLDLGRRRCATLFRQW